LINGVLPKVHCTIMRPLPQRRNYDEPSWHERQEGTECHRAPPQMGFKD
jgi:hypothetical protein